MNEQKPLSDSVSAAGEVNLTTHRRQRTMCAMRFLVTAGATVEMIDEVRTWSNIFTGSTGLAIACALAQEGAVDLVTSNLEHIRNLQAQPQARFPITCTAFRSHNDLRDAIERLITGRRYDAVFMTAAVADYRPVRVYAVKQRSVRPEAPGAEQWLVSDVQAPKVGSGHEAIAVLAVRTEKIIDMFRSRWGYRGLLVKFKLEVAKPLEELLRIGENSRLASGADYLVANTLEMVNGPAAGAYLLYAGGHEWVPRERLPGRMVSLATQRPTGSQPRQT